MTKLKPIVIVEDDEDDCAFLLSALKETGINNPFHCFSAGDEALEYLKKTTDEIFLIISDVNMPRMNGLDLKKNINKNEYLNNKTIPFVFLSTSSSELVVKEAFMLCPQGFFKKPTNLAGLSIIAHDIINYWSHNILPSNKLNKPFDN